MSDQKFLDRILAVGPVVLLQEPPPVECPIALPASDKDRLKLLEMPQVPLQLRALLQHVVEARHELSRDWGPRPGQASPYRRSCLVEDVAVLLEEELRRVENLGSDEIVFFEADWRYWTTTHEKETARYEMEELNGANGNLGIPKGGPRYDEMRTWPDPPHRLPRSLLEHYLGLNDKAAFDRAVGRDKNPKAV